MRVKEKEMEMEMMMVKRSEDPSCGRGEAQTGCVRDRTNAARVLPGSATWRFRRLHLRLRRHIGQYHAHPLQGMVDCTRRTRGQIPRGDVLRTRRCPHCPHRRVPERALWAFSTSRDHRCTQRASFPGAEQRNCSDRTRG